MVVPMYKKNPFNIIMYREATLFRTELTRCYALHEYGKSCLTLFEYFLAARIINHCKSHVSEGVQIASVLYSTHVLKLDNTPTCTHILYSHRKSCYESCYPWSFTTVIEFIFLTCLFVN